MSFKTQLVNVLTRLALLLINIGVFVLAYVVMLGLELGETQELFWGYAILIAMLISAAWLTFKVAPRVVTEICESMPVGK